MVKKKASAHPVFMSTIQISASRALLLITCLLLFDVSRLASAQLTNYKKQQKCPPFSCGPVQDIGYPFRSKGDPPNVAIIDISLPAWMVTRLSGISTTWDVLHSKFTVVDANLANGSCSLPLQSLSRTSIDNLGFIDFWFTWATFVSCTRMIVNSTYNPVPCLSRTGAFVYVIFSWRALRLEDTERFCSFLAMTPITWDREQMQLMNGDIYSLEHPPIDVFQLLKRGFSVPILARILDSSLRDCEKEVERSLNSRQICYCAIGNIPLPGAQVVERKEISGRCREVPSKPEGACADKVCIYRPHCNHRPFQRKARPRRIRFRIQSVFPGGVLVAVKMLLSNSRCNGEEFINEVSTIGRIHHVNVIKLVGFCSEGSKRALVYEYMPQGSLDKHIFTSNGVAGRRTFTWDKLNDIALGIARGINYLHQGCDKRILHFDIKPQNILLDRNFTPKVADFGLAKLYPKDTSLVSMSTTRGTTGYIAPELISRSFGIISHKSDVYSFGMLLMEMAGGRRNADPRAENSSQAYYPSWIYDRLTQPEIHEISTTFDISEGERKLCIVGLWCIQVRPSARPAMSKVIEMLEADVETLEMPPKPFFSSEEPIPAISGRILVFSKEEELF
uniref:Protein kinase domain-containing protein n=1 Tax=Ananas comosus var. bracteatus TaxID=296719 RepID=A0A6V7QHU5_ANACO|nr:unnamed protein product [Ananas comosus var. bracteatus]